MLMPTEPATCHETKWRHTFYGAEGETRHVTWSTYRIHNNEQGEGHCMQIKIHANQDVTREHQTFFSLSILFCFFSLSFLCKHIRTPWLLSTFKDTYITINIMITYNLSPWVNKSFDKSEKGQMLKKKKVCVPADMSPSGKCFNTKPECLSGS